jgi:CRP-like cAMP-binding protein
MDEGNQADPITPDKRSGDSNRAGEERGRTRDSLSPELLQVVLRYARPVVYPPGQPIIRQGEEGDTFYVILEGATDVFVRRPDGSDLLVDRRHAREYFGEIALMGDGQRTATVRAPADAPVTIVPVDRFAFKEMLNGSAAFREQLLRLVETRQQIVAGVMKGEG